MPSTTASERYYGTESLGATPGGLAVLALDALLKCLERAHRGIADADYDRLMPALEQAQQHLGELLVMLDRTTGSEIATRLAALYAFLMTELLSIATTMDLGRLERNSLVVRELREAFAHVARTEAEPLARAGANQVA